MLGDTASQELHAVKRLSFAERTTARLAFPAHTSAGAPVTSVTLHLVRPARNMSFTPSPNSMWCGLPAKSFFLHCLSGAVCPQSHTSYPVMFPSGAACLQSRDFY